MAFPVAAAVAAGGQGLQALLDYMQQKRQQDFAEISFGREKQQYEDALRMAKEGRGDVFGNRVVYKPGIGWTYELTPRSEQLVSGEQQAQLREQDLAQQGGEDYQRARSEYLYGPRESQEELQNEFTRLGLIGREKGLKEGQSFLARQALRANMGNLIPRFIREADELFGKSFEEMLLKGRQAGREEYRAGEKFRTEQGGNDLTRFLQQAKGSPNIGLDTSLGRTASGSIDDLVRALGDTSGMNQAYSSMANNIPKLDITGVTNSLGTLLGKLQGGTNVTTRPKSTSRLFPSGGVET